MAEYGSVAAQLFVHACQCGRDHSGNDQSAVICGQSGHSESDSERAAAISARMPSHWQHRVLRVSFPGTPAECPLHQVTYSWPGLAAGAGGGPTPAQCGDDSRGSCGESPVELEEPGDEDPGDSRERRVPGGSFGLGRDQQPLASPDDAPSAASAPPLSFPETDATITHTTDTGSLRNRARGQRSNGTGHGRGEDDTVGDRGNEKGSKGRNSIGHWVSQGTRQKGKSLTAMREHERRSIWGSRRPCWTWKCEVGLICGRGIELRQTHCVHWDRLLLLLLRIPWRLLAALTWLLLSPLLMALGLSARKQVPFLVPYQLQVLFQ